MASSWRIKRGYRPKVSTAPEDYFRIDSKKSPEENAQDIYTALFNVATKDTKRLYLLNGFVTLFQQNNPSGLGFSTEELLYCLSASLIHTFTQVRAAALRAIRYLLTSSNELHIFNALQLAHLVCRSIDVLLKNDDERVQAFKLVRKMLATSPENISPVIVRCLVSLGDSGMEDGDRMLRACLATLCEFGVLNPTLLIVCGGVGTITRNILECHSPRIAESLCGVLLHLLEWPRTRDIAGVRLDCLAAPYCDFTYRLGIMDKNKDARELRYTSSRLALLSVLRSWAGILEFCDPNKPSGLKAIVDVLYLNQLEVRKAILDLLYELLGLPQPIWTDEYSVALSTVDPSDFQDGWLLINGFVAMEGRCILPSLASKVPNICEQHFALLLACFLETGLLNALVEVIVSSDTFISVRATILVGKLLHMMHTHLPADICSTSPALPTLISYATNGNYQANAAVKALQNFHHMMRNRPASSSLFLDTIIRSGNLINTRLFKRDLISTQENTMFYPISSFLTLERKRMDSVSSSVSGGEENTTLSSGTTKRSSFRAKRKRFTHFFESVRELDRLIKDSNVLAHADGNTWDWEIITTILRTEAIDKLDDTKTRFFKRLVHYFKPSSNRFSHQDLSHGRTIPAFVIAGLDLIDWLTQSNELAIMRMLTDLFADINQQLLSISTSNRAHDCLFSPQHMSSTMCQQYFLFIGRMCRTEKGLSVLINTAIFEQLSNLITNTDHVCYVKLIVSGLDYSNDSYARKMLEKALTSCKMRSGRLYATQFMLVLLRAGIPNFEVWGIPLLISQTKDSERSIVLAAMEALDEACHDKNCLEELVSIWPNFSPLGDVGRLLMSRYYSIPRGLNHKKTKIKEEVHYWANGFNNRYVLLIEADIHASLTLHIKNEDGYYSRRNCSSRPIVIPPNIPPHLYGQLAQTQQGMSSLKKFGNLDHLVSVVLSGKCSDEGECLDLKAALWAIGHVSTHSNGIEYINDTIFFQRVYKKVIALATSAEVYSIRSTAFSILGLVASTNDGANLLFQLDWLSVRHDRNKMWPVYQQEDWNAKNITPVRHQYEEVPPYNYKGIDEQLDGFNTSSDSNSFLDENSEFKIKEESELQTQLPAASKSKTLPENVSARFIKHTRSLSESKTTDVLSLISGHQHHRTRFNSGTDSNTSGVSSCESVFGRTIIGDMQQPQLSPIPSTSNLLDVASTKIRFRRTSLTGTQYRSDAISPQDIKGYATLRSLRRHCRPVLSESAADELADIIDRDEILSTLRPRKLSIGDSHRKWKASSLDRHTSTHLISRLNSEEFQVPLPTLNAPKFLTQNELKGPCYSGICLPKQLHVLFPERSTTRTHISQNIQDQDLMDINLITAKQEFLNDSINEGDASSVVSSISDISSVSKRSKWIGRHSRGNCLYCSRARIHRLQPSAGSEISIFKRKSNLSSSIQLSDISFNSPESILSEDSIHDRLTANILHHVQRLANPVSCKQSKTTLLDLKQKHPTSFQDICLYSEVCKTLGRSTYRMNARRFLQELFLDLNFDCFYIEPNDVRFRRDIDNISCISLSTVDDTHEVPPTSSIISEQLPQHQSSSSVPTFSTNLKVHIKSPVLESVYETSIENLTDSLPKSNKLALNQKQILYIKPDRQSQPVTICSQLNPNVENNIVNNNINHENSTSKLLSFSTSRPNSEDTDAIDVVDCVHASRNLCMSTSNSCSDGNRSSIICKPIAAVLENENKQFTRGRFYTLELDLSCTKNKFPITDRKTTIANNSSTSKYTPSLCGKYATTTASAYCQDIQFTKSLSASISKPIGSLFCEKRLQSSKSEAILSQSKPN